MSIDLKKFKKILQKNEIMILEYYLMDNQCCMMKCFLNKTCDFLIVYVPTKRRFPVSGMLNTYHMEEISENTENDDYSKSSKVPDMENIDEEKSVSTYQELTKKYKTAITLEGTEEPISRKLKRQINRVRIPFQRLSYDISLQQGIYLYVSFGDNIGMYSIKGYNQPNNRTVLYLVNLKDFIEKMEDITDEINIIKTQFYDILKKVSLSNLADISKEVDDYQNIVKRVVDKRTEYEKSFVGYKALFEKVKEKEEEIIENFQKVVANEQGVKRSTLENKVQSDLNQLFKEKNDVIKSGIILSSKFQKNLLIFEETTFDNSVMIERVNKNFQQMKEIL